MTRLQSKTKWDSLAETWSDAGPPASPSKDDLRIYRRFLKQGINKSLGPSVLILGATPRLRLLAARLKVPVTCVDISEQMLAKTTQLMPANTMEQLVCQDWLQLDLGGKKFSTIVGDKFFDNVPYGQWSILKERLLNHLQVDGFVITRVAPQDMSLCGQSFLPLLRKWAVLHENGSVSLERAASGLWEQALGASARDIPGVQSIQVFNTEIKTLENNLKRRRNASETALLRKFVALFGNSIRFEWTAYTLGNVIDALAEELRLVRLERAADYAVGHRQPILQFRNIKP